MTGIVLERAERGIGWNPSVEASFLVGLPQQATT